MNVFCCRHARRVDEANGCVHALANWCRTLACARGARQPGGVLPSVVTSRWPTRPWLRWARATRPSRFSATSCQSLLRAPSRLACTPIPRHRCKSSSGTWRRSVSACSATQNRRTCAADCPVICGPTSSRLRDGMPAETPRRHGRSRTTHRRRSRRPQPASRCRFCSPIRTPLLARNCGGLWRRCVAAVLRCRRRMWDGAVMSATRSLVFNWREVLTEHPTP